ncbi:MAG: MATE family efflux transporter, partial [Gemmatimonadaceae bacterium]
TLPSLISSTTRLVTFAAPALWLAQRPGFRLRQVGMLSVVTMTAQAGFTLWLLRSEMRRRSVVTAA